MAEFVEFRAEEWVGELEQMERIRLFETKEIKAIAKKRREFEYKIQRRTKYKEDYLKYIQFEVDLQRIIKARRKRTGIKAKIAEIDFSQHQRVANLFKQVVFKFQSDVKLWMSFFSYCDAVKFHSLISQMLGKMLQIHSNKVNLWIFAARWEYNKCKSFNTARQFLMKGLRHHPSSNMLYEELFKLELIHIKKKQKQLEKKLKRNENFVPTEVMRNILQGNVIDVIYQSAIQAIPRVDFKVDILNIFINKKAPENLIKKVFQDIVTNHLNDELTWNVIAKREYRGFSCDLSSLIEGDTDAEMDEAKEVSLRDKIQRSINVYVEGVEKFKSVRMWNFYLEFVVKLNEKNAKSLPFFKLKLLNQAMEDAMNSNYLPEKYFLKWIVLLQNAKKKHEKLPEILKRGTDRYSDSLELWYARVKFYLSCDDAATGMEVFKKAIQNLPHAPPLWSLMVQYLLKKSSPAVEEIFLNGISRGENVSPTLKPLYIEWLVKAKGIEEARRAFKSPELNVTPCLEMYKKMAEIELSQASPCIEKVRKCHELACSNFGEVDSNVWLKHIEFELKNGEPSKITQVHRRALKRLRPEEVDNFVSEFNNFKLNNSVSSS